MKKSKIGIIGIGTVGGALNHYFNSRDIKPFLYDKYNGSGSTEEINKADIIFVCVPTPYDNKNGFDLSAVEDALRIINGRKTVVIKSTVLPGTTEKLQKKYPQHKFLFNPEFLDEATANKDMQKPDVQIVGYTSKSKKIAKDILKILPRAPFGKIIPAKGAEMIKYFHNTHGAIEVIFANQIYDLCQKLKINYDVMPEFAVANKNIKTSRYFNVWHKGFRGYGGKCFPKDMRALIHFANQLGVDLKLHKVAEKINNQLLKKDERNKSR